MPKRTKFRKMQKGRVKGLAQRGARVEFGDYGIKALEAGWITSRQIESARIAMTRKMKRVGKVWIRIFPDKPITKKPAETRMGKGKGSPEYFVAVVKPGRILFEIGGVDEETARESMRLAIQKLPIKAKVVMRPELTPVPAPAPEPPQGDGQTADGSDDGLPTVQATGSGAESVQAPATQADAGGAQLTGADDERPVETDAEQNAADNATNL